MPINYRDPRYQNALLAAHGNPKKNAYGIQKELTEKWAGQQQEVLNKFKSLENEKQYFNDRMKLGRRKFRFESNMFKRRLNNAQEAQNQGIWMGLGTSLIAGLIGRDRRMKAEAMGLKQMDFQLKEAKKAEDFRNRMTELRRNS